MWWSRKNSPVLVEQDKQMEHIKRLRYHAVATLIMK